MKKLLLLPNQLFKESANIKGIQEVILLEHPKFFSKKFHKNKILLHRASMKSFEKLLKSKKIKTRYITCGEYSDFKKKNHKNSVIFEIPDHQIKDEFCESQFINSPNFLTKVSDINSYFEKNKKHFQTDFYIWQRKRLNILIEGNGPTGGKWTYDSDNRKPLHKKTEIPKQKFFCKHENLANSRKYIDKHFRKNIGSNKGFFYPTTHGEADELLDYFLEKKLSNFGKYQDAIDRDNPYVFHSLLSSSINIGLLHPKKVVKKALIYQGKVPINSLEGFIRQIIGWREFARAIYIKEGKKQMRSNFFKFKKKMSNKFYNANTGIEPVDNTIKNVLHTAYAHHIERLMILGNFMLLCEIDPDEVNAWFWEMFIDSYEWVMVPNVYGMAQFADGGMMVTKPYISSSNYVLKMSNYKKGEWCDIWDGLYWRFLDKHREKLEDIPRMGLVYSILDKMETKKLQEHKNKAEKFLNRLG